MFVCVFVAAAVAVVGGGWGVVAGVSSVSFCK